MTTTNPQATVESRSGKAASSRWWRRPWIGPLLLACLAFLIFSLPPYLSLDPAQSRIEVREDVFFHYPLLVAHIFLGSVALITCCFQVWPRFRQQFPAVHRWMGRAYLFAGVFPAGVMTLVIAPLSSQGAPTAVANFLLGALWLLTGIAGYKMARQRRFADHRKWMVRGFALTWAIVVDRLWQTIWLVALLPLTSSVYGGDQEAVVRDAAGVAIWLSVVVNLLIAEWWLQYRKPAGRRVQKVSRSDFSQKR